MIGELTDLQIRNILSSQVIGRLGCTDGKQPYIVPVTFTYDGEYIYGQTNEGMKLQILRKNPLVCFEVDMMMNMRNWQSVVVFGKFEALRAAQADEAREILFNRVFPLMTSSTLHAHEHEVKDQPAKKKPAKHIMYRIKIKKITGRFEKE